MHMLPANTTLARQLCRIRRHDVARLTGWLVRVEGKDGGHWTSSLARNDTGIGSCEVVWVRTCERLK